MKSSALCHHPLTKKRWSLEYLVSVPLIPLHCEGKAFSWELSKYHSSASCCKDFLHGGRGVCVCCVCLTLWRVRDDEQTITVTLRGVTDALWQPLLALVRESQLGGQELPSCRVC